MKTRNVTIKKTAYDDISNIIKFISAINTEYAAKKYIENLKQEIYSISYLADCFPCSQWKTAKKYNKKAKRFITKNKKWNIIFHIRRNYVIIDKIIPSRLKKE